MSTNIRQFIHRELRNGTLTGASPLVDARGIGPYLEGRLRRALSFQRPLTIGDVWRTTRPKRTAQLERILHRALQNRRANQCVASSPRNDARTYHTGDINQLGYEAMVALLDHARIRGDNVAYGPLPVRFPARPVSSKRCGCSARCDGPCVRVNGVCIPRSHNARGFVGVSPHPDQGATALTDADRARVRRKARSPGGNAASLRADADSASDTAAGHARSLRYVRRGNRMWRSPGSKVRAPVIRR